ncbi:tsaC protein [Vibrio ishigakensis]|uniref:Threonylcarbamoyl-AMP synthase n=1 Tax=Vibrio ishigakensis TaxID=1481914 RepID=A0A0B8NSJ2_9VIBR|nr:L-threonylcarbamoyladenylate synthase [Vibrio ishigakensis]GAM55302.1 tsaC protein [Vibrio ishigakensis]
MTEILLHDNGIERAKQMLINGECVAVPTETVYGLAADAKNPDAVLKIFQLKGRPTDHPLIVHVPDISHIEHWAKDVPDCVAKLAGAFWPGPLTLILNAKEGLDNPVTGGLKTIALRIPAQPLFLRLLKELDTGLAAPSANRYKGLSPTSSEQVFQQLNGRIKAILDGGKCEHGIESTILDVTGEQPRVLRAGPISASDIEEVIKQPVSQPKKHDTVVPGNVAAHYQPDTPVSLISRTLLMKHIDEGDNQGTCYLVYSDECIEALDRNKVPRNRRIELISTPAKYAKHLYFSLYELDNSETTEIKVEAPPRDIDWSAVNDRLSRAASFVFFDTKKGME